MAQIILIYAGQVELQKGGLGAKYMVENGGENIKPMFFKKRLLGYESIGTKILCEENDSKVTIIETVKGKADAEFITQCSIKERAMLEARKLRRDLKVKDSADIDSLIEAVKSTYLNHTERKAIALYIFNKLA